MTDHDSLLAILNQQEKVLASQTAQLSNIEKSLVGIAVQEKDISYINMQIDALWKKYDVAFGPEGTISKLQACAAKCPADTVKTNLSRQWVAIGLIFTLIGLLKIWG